MSFISLPLCIMQNYPFYFQLISGSQIHILQFEFLNTWLEYNLKKS